MRLLSGVGGTRKPLQKKADFARYLSPGQRRWPGDERYEMTKN